ncbi:MAG TPA: hypothetical protein VGM03_21050 [Phycisphaerae bacterium]|jgi:hypothetical protein
MSIPLPIELHLTRPMTRPDSPYGQCGQCQYVGTDISLGLICPACGASQATACGVWPSPEFVELWDDVIFAWNENRPELCAVLCATYFEASVFNLIYYGTCWLDPELNWIGAAFGEVRDKSERIWEYLLRIRSTDATEQALRRLFGVDGKTMLETVLGAEAKPFWDNYRRLAEFRNQIVHKGRRLWYRTVNVNQDRAAADQMLAAGMFFVPTCWVVFSKLWNEYVHKPMRAKAISKPHE